MKLLTTIFALLPLTLVGCGDKASTSAPSDIFGRTLYTVAALVINESDKPVEVVFANGGPHGGGCDSKNWVLKQVVAKTAMTLTEEWRCSMEQNFSVIINPNTDASLTIKGQSAKVICSDEGCRKLDVR